MCHARGVPPLNADEIKPLLAKLENGWTVLDNHHVEKVFFF